MNEIISLNPNKYKIVQLDSIELFDPKMKPDTAQMFFLDTVCGN
jgi:hypothetical protein